MKYYIIKADKRGYVGRIYWRDSEYKKIMSVDYVNDGLLAMKCSIREVWHEEKLRLAIEDYLESKNILYEVHILDYNISLYWRSEER